MARSKAFELVSVRSQYSASSALAIGASLICACTLSFDLPKAVDGGEVVDDASTPYAADVDLPFAACSSPFDSVSVNALLEAGDFEVDREGWSNSAVFLQDSTEARLGNSSLHVAQGTGTRNSNREFPVQASTLFTVSASIKTAGVTGNGCRIRSCRGRQIRW